jgi:hypothetical protein
VTADGTKVPLAVMEGTTENKTLVTRLLADLQDRGLDVSGGVLFGISTRSISGWQLSGPNWVWQPEIGKAAPGAAFPISQTFKSPGWYRQSNSDSNSGLP